MCILTLITQKLKVINGHSTYQKTALLSEMSIFYVRAGCKVQLSSYGSKHVHVLQSLFDKPLVPTYMLNLKTTRHIMNFLKIEQLLYHRRHSLCGLELH